MSGMIHWPAKEGRLIIIDPFHVAAFGLTPGKDGEEPGWIVWVDVGGQMLHFEKDREKAFQQFERIRLAKVKN